ncbi:Carbamoyl-phosphate synthase L chain ATP- binding protein [Segniliparus rotundus DSM 44985]|uniref:Carbamoyl-phosphate synthase L chain ATP-binding protein n=1 Tax=Segniliparus rotundus (strain ATCC BAA-972 / CDC 1076 / CIP 108378 / DSM 44985 / JCM 13578) TaxID=640132 RepID=D6ZAX0_SEGRD|nr:biotin carboxylase N-terminal domain-containing protein [Segniliparus rotundus]ADG98856.1 Carbamoyl-phosphate synthase L chain ATP- binding protein [Segniliparus rotundus DSM 44985]
MAMTSVLVANRGEIACRVFHTCRRLGVATVAVFSDADAASPHVAEADSAVRLPGNAPADTYLRGDLIIDAAKRAGADAVHPGYGFLSENADFARAVREAGLTWIGPSPESIELMGSKIAAKERMAAVGVPIFTNLDPASVAEADFPVLVKASAGGGGRGMRVVRDVGELAAAVDSAAAEALSAFGSGAVFCEPYLQNAHHIEVQLMADRHGTVWAVGERECSLQRRHQKVVEEAPAPLVERIGPALRERLFEAARSGAKAIGYEGAGTFEFLVSENGDVRFLEMNTRLQVEHPVTEATTGLDLVELQLRVADGEALGPEPPKTRGHAIEVRLYAEDPANDYRPQTGVLRRFELEGAQFQGPSGRGGLRVDAGFASGSHVSPYYDAMLAKVIAYAPTRGEAARILRGALLRAKVHGLVTNRELLANILAEPEFLEGKTDTGYLDRIGLDTLAAPVADAQAIALSALAAAVADAKANQVANPVLAALPTGWRNLPSQLVQKAFITADGQEIAVRYRFERGRLLAPEHPDVALLDVRLGSGAAAHEVLFEAGGVLRRFAVSCAAADGGHDVFDVDSPLGPVALRRKPAFTDPADQIVAGSLIAPMPGSVIKLGAQVGERVRAGQPILWLEAMKMQHAVNSPADGTLVELDVAVGDQVNQGAMLARVEETNPAEEAGTQKRSTQ